MISFVLSDPNLLDGFISPLKYSAPANKKSGRKESNIAFFGLTFFPQLIEVVPVNFSNPLLLCSFYSLSAHRSTICGSTYLDSVQTLLSFSLPSKKDIKLPKGAFVQSLGTQFVRNDATDFY